MKTDHPFTPTIECDHQCQVRRQFFNKDQAMAVATAILNRTGVSRPVERCRTCSGWHLGYAR